MHSTIPEKPSGHVIVVVVVVVVVEVVVVDVEVVVTSGHPVSFKFSIKASISSVLVQYLPVV